MRPENAADNQSYPEFSERSLIWIEEARNDKNTSHIEIQMFGLASEFDSATALKRFLGGNAQTILIADYISARQDKYKRMPWAFSSRMIRDEAGSSPHFINAGGERAPDLQAWLDRIGEAEQVVIIHLESFNEEHPDQMFVTDHHVSCINPNHRSAYFWKARGINEDIVLMRKSRMSPYCLKQKRCLTPCLFRTTSVHHV